MYIKSITLRGFLCYKEATTVVLNPHLNIIVGPNGSGKSSLLSAIRFALGVEATSDRQLWLHHGSSSKVLVGYVTLVLDNSDGRLTGYEKSDVAIRRDFSAQRDDITLNGKRVTRHELLSLLEAAGFSRSNPYYFTHQHEVSALARMSNTERLKTLKECAGTKVYDDRRAKAVKSLAETRAGRKTIDSMLDMITARVDELKEEQKELLQCLVLEKEKSCLTAVLAAKELESVNADLNMLRSKVLDCERCCNSLSGQRAAFAEQLDQLHQSEKCEAIVLESLKENLGKVQVKLRESKKQHARQQLLMESAKQKERERCRMIKTKKDALRKLEKTRTQLQQKIATLHKEEEALQRSIQDEEANQLKLQQQLHQLCIKESSTSPKMRLNDVETQLLERCQSLATVQKLTEQTKAQIHEAQQQLQAVTSNIAPLSETLSSLHSAATNSADNQFSICWQGRSLTDQEAINLQSKLEKDLAAARNTTLELQSAVSNQTQKLYQTMRPHQLKAYHTCREWASKKGNFGEEYFGTLLENLTVDSEYHLAVETAAGNQLFNLLVSNKYVATQLIKHFWETQAGSAVVTPLDNINPPPEISDSAIRSLHYSCDAKTVIPLTRVINAPDRVAPAVRQVFGRFLLIQNNDLDVAHKMAQNGYDCITLEGDLVSRNGTLTGGFRAQTARLSIVSELRQTEQRLNLALADVDGLQRELQHLHDARVTAASQVAQLQEQHDTVRERQYAITKELAACETERDRCNRRASALNASLLELEAQVVFLNDDIKRLDTAKETIENGHSLKFEETEGFASLEARCAESISSLKKYDQQMEKIQSSIAELRAEYHHNVLPQIKALEADLRDLHNKSSILDGSSAHETFEPLLHTVEALNKECETYEAEMRDLETKCSDTAQRQEHLDQDIRNAESQIEDVRRNETLAAAELRLVQQQLEALQIRAETLEARQQTLSGANERMKEFLELSQYEAAQKLNSINQKLQANKLVNRKALDQFNTFVDEQKQLLQQRDSLQKDEDSVTRLLDVLDKQKDTTLLKTFENVNTHFNQVFREIVPGGKVKLVLKKFPPTTDLEAEQVLTSAEVDNANKHSCNAHDHYDPEHQGDNFSPTTDHFSGIGIKVRFPTSHGYVPLESLSGGQKSTVALALMFAMQRVEGSPFYVLDEIDANLDAQYRGAVAQLVQRQAETHQLIVISHKVPMIRVGNWFLKTELVGQVTRVNPTTLEDALAISQIRTLPQHPYHPENPTQIPQESLSTGNQVIA